VYVVLRNDGAASGCLWARCSAAGVPRRDGTGSAHHAELGQRLVDGALDHHGRHGELLDVVDDLAGQALAGATIGIPALKRRPDGGFDVSPHK